MNDDLDEALEGRLRHFLRAACAARTMPTPGRQEKFLAVCLQEAVRDVRKLCEAGPGGPAKFRALKRHLGLLNGEGLPERGTCTAPELRLVE